VHNLVHFESCNELDVEMQEVGQQLNLESYVTIIDKLIGIFDVRFFNFNRLKG